MQPGYRTTPETEEEIQEREDYFTQASQARASQINTEDPGFLQNAVNTFNNINRLGADDEPLTYVNPETGEEQQVEMQNLQYTPAMAGKLGMGLRLPSAGNLIRAGIAGASVIGATQAGNITDYLQRMVELDSLGNANIDSPPVDTNIDTQTSGGGPGETPPDGKPPGPWKNFFSNIPNYLRYGIPAGFIGLGASGTLNQGEGEPTTVTQEDTRDPLSELPEVFRESPDDVYKSVEQDILENLQLQQVGAQESYSNLYARAMQDAYRRRAASTSPFTGVGGGQEEQRTQSLSAAEINQLGQIGSDYSQMMRDIEGMRLAAPQQAREAALQQFGIQQQQQDIAVQRTQYIYGIMNDPNYTDEQRAELIRPYMEGTPQEVEDTLNDMFEAAEENKGWINWNEVAALTGAGALVGSVVPGAGTIAGGVVGGLGSIARQGISEIDWLRSYNEDGEQTTIDKILYGSRD